MSLDRRPKWTNSQSNIEAPTDRPFCSHPMKQVCWIMDVLDRFVQYDECGLEMKRFCRGQDELGAWIWRRRHVHLPKAKGATKWMEESLGWVLWSNSPRREQSFSWKAPQFSLLSVNFANKNGNVAWFRQDKNHTLTGRGARQLSTCWCCLRHEGTVLKCFIPQVSIKVPPQHTRIPLVPMYSDRDEKMGHHLLDFRLWSLAEALEVHRRENEMSAWKEEKRDIEKPSIIVVNWETVDERSHDQWSRSHGRNGAATCRWDQIIVASTCRPVPVSVRPSVPKWARSERRRWYISKYRVSGKTQNYRGTRYL